MADDDVSRRLERIERKLDEKVVYKDVYEAQREAIKEEIAAMAVRASNDINTAKDFMTAQVTGAKGVIEERADGIDRRVSSLEDWRKTIYALIATAYIGLLGSIVLYLLQNNR